MTDPRWNALLDPPAFPPDAYAPLANRIAALLSTRSDVVFVQAEAVVALEAVAASLAAPGLKALNVVTSPYGAWFGGWLRRGGADVRDLRAEPARPVTVDAVAAALEEAPDVRLLSLVHAESASGILNPLEEIAALSRDRGIVTVVDAVASIGGHALNVDALGIDIAVVGPQKALGGPTGVSAVSVSGRAWTLVDRPDAPADSMLSLLDLKRHWLETGRGALPGTPAPLEFLALSAALDRIEAEGIANVVARHARAAVAARAALRALGLRPFVEEAGASRLVTAVELPEGIAVAALLAAAPASAELTAGVGPGAERLVRLNHTGPRASRERLAVTVEGFAEGLRRCGYPADAQGARAAAEAAFG